MGLGESQNSGAGFLVILAVAGIVLFMSMGRAGG